MKKVHLNLVQLILFPILSLIGIMGLSWWLRDLIILEWDIPILLASIGGYIISLVIILMCCFDIYAIIKLYRIITKFVSETELEQELHLLKSKN